MGIDMNNIIQAINKFDLIPGRFESYRKKNGGIVIIDYAHTPDAFKKILSLVKSAEPENELITLFGCGGDRDKDKRSIMGSISENFSDRVIITDDNPRYENPKIIRNTIIKGCGKVYANIGNRKLAIKKAIKKLELESNQLLFVAGKGHENNQDYGRKIIKFSDCF